MAPPKEELELELEEALVPLKPPNAASQNLEFEDDSIAPPKLLNSAFPKEEEIEVLEEDSAASPKE